MHHSVSPRDCFHFGEDQGHWYGGGESLNATWPLQKGHIKKSPFITGDEVSILNRVSKLDITHES